MLKGGVIMDVVNAEQAKIAEQAGAAAVMALERVPADIRRDGGVARMSPVSKIREIQQAVSIPVMAKCRIGHTAEARILEALKVDFIDESEVLTPADEENHVYKHDFKIPFVCGCRNLGRGPAAHRRGGGDDPDERGGGHRRRRARRQASARGLARHSKPDADDAGRADVARPSAWRRPYELVVAVAETGKLPVPNFAAGGIATPADAALCMSLGAEAIFVGSGIFKSDDPANRARAIVKATTHWRDAQALVEAEESLGSGMKGIEAASLPEEARLQTRGW